MTKKNKVPAVQIAHNLAADQSGGPVQLSTGYWVRIGPVSASLIDDAQALVKDPEPPMVYIDEKGRDEPNPSDPAYLRAVQRADVDRVMAALDTILMMGIELVVDENGESYEVEKGKWLKKLQFLESRGKLDLSMYDLDDQLAIEFIYKKYIVVSTADIQAVSMSAGITEESVALAEASFQDQTT